MIYAFYSSFLLSSGQQDVVLFNTAQLNKFTSNSTVGGTKLGPLFYTEASDTLLFRTEIQRWDEQRWERVSCQTYLYMSWWSCPVHILGNSHRCIPRPPEYTGRSHSRAGCRSHLRCSNQRRTHSALRDQTRIRTHTQIHKFLIRPLQTLAGYMEMLVFPFAF